MKFGKETKIKVQKYRTNNKEMFQGLFMGYFVKDWWDGILKTNNIFVYYEKILEILTLVIMMLKVNFLERF
ncbi:hypothetical protein OLS38_01015 [Campylobacter jejuni]|nr:hypothetical protein [Campylobacter jejuni]